AGLLLLAWVVARSIQAHGLPALRGWCGAALAAALLYSAIVMVGVITLLSLGHMDTRNLFIGFANRRFFLQLTTPLLPCLLALVFDPALVRHFRVVAAVGALLWAILIWLNDGSGALYALVLGLCATAALVGVRRVVPLAVAIAVCLLAGWLLMHLAEYWLPVKQALQSAVYPGISGRMQLWQRAIAAIAEQPLFGWGPGA